MANTQQGNKAGPAGKAGMRVDFGKQKKQKVRAVHRTNLNNQDTPANARPGVDADADDASA